MSKNETRELFTIHGWYSNGIRKARATKGKSKRGLDCFWMEIGKRGQWLPISPEKVFETYDEAFLQAQTNLDKMKARHDVTPWYLERITFCHPDYK